MLWQGFPLSPLWSRSCWCARRAAPADLPIRLSKGWVLSVASQDTANPLCSRPPLSFFSREIALVICVIFFRAQRNLISAPVAQRATKGLPPALERPVTQKRTDRTRVSILYASGWLSFSCAQGFPA
ncbi:hypothetical protein TW95_gp0299 [Pandoravirus inopinatum]|uniref:Uncharacterized protein n=1 Tax=Pandoravirus inopinatum TaxID=1605721 RepID=A0A0B5IWF6_9VIRU|nr:hypothetical protein TW95_gp0299 [Pandoravirus inopinatum]AJF97033.1 hypothetical protein [Pandoravirus inopinatum]